MRTLIAIFFAAAVLSASAQNPAHDLIDGFVRGLNSTELTSDILTLHNISDIVRSDVSNVVNALKARDTEAVATGLEITTQDVYQLLVALHDILNVTDTIVEEFVINAQNLTENTLLNNVMSNYAEVNNDYAIIKQAYNNSDFETVGLTVASLAKIVVFGHSNLPLSTKRARLLAEATQVGDALTDILNAVLLVQGFLGEANTTINVTDYSNLVNDATYAAVLAQPVVNDAKAENISALLGDAQALWNQLLVVRQDLEILKVEVQAWIARDLPLFEDHNRVVTAAESLLEHWAVTEQNIQNIENAYNQSDYEGAGSAIGVLYNEFYTVLAQ